jgi:hypothetical protein
MQRQSPREFGQLRDLLQNDVAAAAGGRDRKLLAGAHGTRSRSQRKRQRY